MQRWHGSSIRASRTNFRHGKAICRRRLKQNLLKRQTIARGNKKQREGKLQTSLLFVTNAHQISIYIVSEREVLTK
jgi:hypothetical protein